MIKHQIFVNKHLPFQTPRNKHCQRIFNLFRLIIIIIVIIIIIIIITTTTTTTTTIIIIIIIIITIISLFKVDRIVKYW